MTAGLLNVPDVLNLLHYTPQEHVSICEKHPGATFTAHTMASPQATINGLDGADVWFGVNPIDPTSAGRGTAAQVTRWSALWADLDVKPGGCPDMDTARTITDVVSDMLTSRPVALIYSGHGLQPIWAIDPADKGALLADRPHARALLRRFGRLVAGVAERHGAGVDSVFDLARVLRAPGTVNHKNPTDPVSVLTLPDTGHPITLADLQEALDAYGIPELPEDSEELGDVISPPTEWVWGAKTCGYAAVTIRGWASDTPTARHPWLVSAAVRLAAMHAHGCISDTDHKKAILSTVAQFRHVLATISPQRDPSPGEISQAFSWGQAKTSTMDEARIAKELGGHTHDTADPFGIAAALLTPPAPTQAAQEPPEPPVATWARKDLSTYLDGTHKPVIPTLLERTDGVCLLYPGLVHSLHGESESGKSMVAQYLAAQQIMAGHQVLFIDFESDQAAITQRLLMFGATPQAILKHFWYLQPELNPSALSEIPAWFEMLNQKYTLAVIDGVTDSLGCFGFVSKDNDQVAEWMRLLPKQIAKRTGAAVAVIDHVVKDNDNRGRFAIGAQSKMSGLTGAGYTVEIFAALGRHLKGVIVLRVGKDRPGYIRGKSGPLRKTDRTQESARVVVDSTIDPDHPVITIEPWRGSDGVGMDVRPFRLTGFMEKISRILEDSTVPMSFRRIDSLVTGKQTHVAAAIESLVSERFVIRIDGARNAKMHTSVATYRQAEDPASDMFKPAGDTQPFGSVSNDCRPYPIPTPGDGRQTLNRIPGDSGETVGIHGDTHPQNPQCAICNNRPAAQGATNCKACDLQHNGVLP